MGVSYSKIDKLRYVRANLQKGYVVRLRFLRSVIQRTYKSGRH